MNADPRSLLTEVRHIVACAEREHRDLTPTECERCDCLLDAAGSLSKVQRMDATGMSSAIGHAAMRLT